LSYALQVKLHPWFRGLDWASLARTKAAFIPAVDHEYDTSYFTAKPVRPPLVEQLTLPVRQAAS